MHANFTESPCAEAHFSIFRASMNTPVSGNEKPGRWKRGRTKECIRTVVIEIGHQRQRKNPNLVRK
jgi:hypothetical protein